MPTALVTGAAGFIGSHLCDTLLAAGWRVTGLDNLSAGALDNLASASASPAFRFVRADAADPALPPELFATDCIFHLAGSKMVFSIKNPAEDLRTNVSGTLNILALAAAHGAKRLVFASSVAVYGEPKTVPTPETAPIIPTNPYGVSKFAGEEYCRLWQRQRGLPSVILRFASVYGPRQATNVGVVSTFISRIQRGEPITITGDGGQVRPLTYVQDVVEANILAATHPAAVGETFNISFPKQETILDLANLVAAQLRKPATIVHTPARPGEMRQIIPDVSKAQRALGFAPSVSLAQGIARTVESYAPR